jgi:NAD(P)H-dependent flavin oxidoreductase YrpB (nitropropane dioxygenase family)
MSKNNHEYLSSIKYFISQGENTSSYIDQGSLSINSSGKYNIPISAISNKTGRYTVTLALYSDKGDVTVYEVLVDIESPIVGVSNILYNQANQNLDFTVTYSKNSLVDGKLEDIQIELTQATRIPFIVKGVMTAKGAIKAYEAGAYGIVVSSHGGRVLADAPATCAMLPEIREAVGDKLKILVDGGIRSGADVFKALALGADAVLIGRPYAIAAFGGGIEGVELYTEKIGAELRETMIMTGCKNMGDITRDKIRL